MNIWHDIDDSRIFPTDFISVIEISRGSGMKYEGRKDLGNTSKGDGPRYKGRGFIQITGRHNYSLISQDLGEDFVNNPELLEQDEWAVASAFWFWKRNRLNGFADNDDVLTITKRINGGTNHLQERKDYLADG